MKVWVVHDARRERYRDDEIYSQVYGVYSTQEAAQARRAELGRLPGMPSYADISSMDVDA